MDELDSNSSAPESFMRSRRSICTLYAEEPRTEPGVPLRIDPGDLCFRGQMPSVIWMAIDRAAWRPKIDYPPIRFVRFTGAALSEGVERHRIENVDVPITDPARTIVECFRYRTKVGLDVAMEGLREGLRRRRCNPDQLWQYARNARVWSVMRPYFEATVSDAA